MAPKKSEPPRGSVSASEQKSFPSMVGFRYFSLCSSLPNSLMHSPTMETSE